LRFASAAEFQRFLRASLVGSRQVGNVFGEADIEALADKIVDLVRGLVALRVVGNGAAIAAGFGRFATTGQPLDPLFGCVDICERVENVGASLRGH